MTNYKQRPPIGPDRKHWRLKQTYVQNHFSDSIGIGTGIELEQAAANRALSERGRQVADYVMASKGSLFEPIDQQKWEQHRQFELQIRGCKNHIRRNQHWCPIIAAQLSTVPSIAWYIQAEIIRTKQLPPGMTFLDINSNHELRNAIRREAARIFRDMFVETTRFTVMDIANKELEGTIGSIDSYDEASESFHCYLDTYRMECIYKDEPGLKPRPENKAVVSEQHGYACYLKPGCLEPLDCSASSTLGCSAPSTHPKYQRVSQYKIQFLNPLLAPCKGLFDVTFRKDLFELITRLWKHPESESNDVLRKQRFILAAVGNETSQKALELLDKGPYAFLAERMSEIDADEEAEQMDEKELAKRMIATFQKTGVTRLLSSPGGWRLLSSARRMEEDGC